MLEITVPSVEAWDDGKEEFVYMNEQNLKLEHSLIALSKWESKWCKPFLVKDEKTNEEMIDYIRCMTINQNVDPNVYNCLTVDNIRAVNDYINAPMSATTITRRAIGGKNGEIVTSELIYYWMVALQIPFECQKWHLNRLIKLIEVCNVKNTPAKKMSKGEIMRQNAAINAARRKSLHSNG